MLSLLLVGRKKRERETARVVFFFFFPQGWTHLAGCASQDFCCYEVKLQADLRL
jgi:hypothetical protein